MPRFMACNYTRTSVETRKSSVRFSSKVVSSNNDECEIFYIYSSDVYFYCRPYRLQKTLFLEMIQSVSLEFMLILHGNPAIPKCTLLVRPFGSFLGTFTHPHIRFAPLKSYFTHNIVQLLYPWLCSIIIMYSVQFPVTSTMQIAFHHLKI